MTWNIFCVSLCLALIIQGTIAVAQAPMAMGPMSMGGNGGHNDTCILMPSMSECANFHMPDPRGDITTLCGMMSNMPGCSIDNICHSNTKLHETEYCTDFSIVKNLCTDMPKMSGCQDYTRMCANGTVVKECDTPSLKTPPTMFLMSAIKKICTDMPTMEQCSKCPDNMDCDLLVVYSELCYSMSDMDGCAEWKAMCTNTAASAWPFCDFASDDTSLPPMRMWFHADVAEIILFRQWIPRNSLAFAGSWFAVALMAFVAEFLRFLRQRAEQKWKFERLGKNDTKFAFGVDVPRALFHTAQLGWGYIVMLLVMTYNVGLFFAVLAGHLFGSLAFGRFMKAHPEPETVTEDCCSTNP